MSLLEPVKEFLTGFKGSALGFDALCGATAQFGPDLVSVSLDRSHGSQPTIPDLFR